MPNSARAAHQNPDAVAAIPRAGETRALIALSGSFSGVFAVRAAAVFVAAGATQARWAGLFPRWFAAASYVVALLLLFTTTFVWPVVTVFPVWVAVVSILILRRNPPGGHQRGNRQAGVAHRRDWGSVTK